MQSIPKYCLGLVGLSAVAVLISAAPAEDYSIHAVPFTEVRIADAFWSPRLETNRVVTIPYAFEQCEKTGRIDNFAKAGKLMEGGFKGIFFNDSDVFKVIEGAAYALAIHRDPDLETYVDGVIDKIAAAQEADGYLYTARTLCGPDYMPPGGKERWSNIRDGHELYNVGHLYEAAIAYYEATGKRKLLDVVVKNADLICDTFGPGKLQNPPGHQQIEIGLARLYRLTGDEKYLRQAKFFLDARGRAEGRELYGEYSQDHKPVVDQEEAVGHSVRAAYLYTGMADVAALTGDPSYVEAIQRIWNDVMERKLYITGGIGAAGGHEGFGAEFFLPNDTAYCETCASVASAMWNHRMFLWTGEGRYMDAAEQVIYNAFLSGIAMNGDRFFYPNRLESAEGERRQPWFDCACCPANIVRFVPSIPGYAYAHTDDTLYVNLFIGGETTVDIAGTSIQVKQETRYPWQGRVQLLLEPENSAEFELAVRVPGWTQNRPTSGNLYRFAELSTAAPTLEVNGRPVDLAVVDGYARIQRTWKAGDKVELALPMPIRRVLADDKVEANRGRVAIQRGPIVFCAEGIDQADPRVTHVLLADSTALNARERSDLLNGVMVVEGKAALVTQNTGGQKELGRMTDLTLVPYYASAHRQQTPMTVWLARDIELARAVPAASDTETVVAMNPGPNLIPNPSFEQGSDERPRRWREQTFGGEGQAAVAQTARTGERSVQLSSTEGADIGWQVTASVEPFGRYRLSGWIKTENVDAGNARGALLNLHNIQSVATDAVSGTKDWTRVEVEFETEDQDSVQVNCLFGGWGTATGRAWFDDLELVQIAQLTPPTPKVAINASEVGAPMSPNIYSQFIEHLGRCIYGGIWAEMLEDRKFYHTITENYAPYTRLRNSDFPVVGRSPWQIMGSADAVIMDEEESFVGTHTPLIQDGNGIRQRDLGVTEGKTYVGYLWLKSADRGAAVDVTLTSAEDGAVPQTVTLKRIRSQYRQFPFEFVANETTDRAMLEVTVNGGAVHIGTLSLMPGDNVEGMRADTLALLKELKAPIYRWPGGNFVSGYDWRDGVGDRDRRPPRTNPAWTGVEHNDFGMHEFIRFCELVETEPWITVNTGFGDAYSAAAQLEYCNGPKNTPMGRRRAENGSPKPFDVRYWGVGNEMWGDWQLGYMRLDHYVLKQNWVVDKMREVDPDIICISSGNAGPWSTGLLRGCSDHMDYIAEHFYSQERPGLMAHIRQIPDNIRRKAEFHRQARRDLPQLEGKDIRISMTEWNYWYGSHEFGELGTRYFLKDALGIAAGLHEYARQSDIIESAFYAQTVNVIGCIKTSRRNAAFATTGLVLKLYREQFGPLPVTTDVEGLIEAQAAWSQDRRTLTLGLVNPSLREVVVPLEVTGANLTGSGRRWQIAGSDPMAYNEPDEAPRVVIEEDTVDNVLGGGLTLAPCSITLLSLDVE